MSSAPTVVTATDLERMHRSINKTLSTTSRSTAPDPSNEKSELRSRSLNKVEKWGNTHVAIRKKKAAEAEERLRQSEEQRRRQDAEETERLSRERREAIERAEQAMFLESDVIRRFHSACLVSDVVHERNAQAKIKTEIAQMERDRLAEQLEVDRVQREKLRQRELAEAEEAKRKAKVAAEVQIAQLREVAQIKAQQRVEDEIEGKAIKARCEAEIREDELAAERRRAAARENNVASMEANRFLKKMREEEALKDAEVDKEVARWAELKEQKNEARRRREAERAAAKQADRNAIIEHTTKAFAKLKSDEEARLAKDINEADNKFQAREEAKKQRQTHVLAEIKASLEEERQRARDQKAHAKAEAARQHALFARRVAAAEALEKAERDARLQAEVEYKQDLAEQLRRKGKQADAEKALETQALQRTKAMRDLEDARAEEYMKDITATYAVDGKPVQPLLRHIEREVVYRKTGRTSKFT